TTTAANGTWQITTASWSSGDVITAYISGDSTDGMVVDIASSTSLTGLDIYGSKLIVRSDNGSAATNANLSTGSANIPAADLVYSVASSNLTVNSNIGLHIWT